MLNYLKIALVALVAVGAVRRFVPVEYRSKVGLG